MIECVDCEEYLREIDRLESRLAAALDALREIRTRTAGFAPMSWETGLWNLADAALAGGGAAEREEKEKSK